MGGVGRAVPLGSAEDQGRMRRDLSKKEEVSDVLILVALF